MKAPFVSLFFRSTADVAVQLTENRQNDNRPHSGGVDVTGHCTSASGRTSATKQSILEPCTGVRSLCVRRNKHQSPHARTLLVVGFQQRRGVSHFSLPRLTALHCCVARAQRMGWRWCCAQTNRVSRSAAEYAGEASASAGGHERHEPGA